MSDSIFCPNCGTRHEGTPKFCYACGTDLSAILSRRAAAAPPSPSQAAAPAPSPQPAPTAPESAPSAAPPPPPWAALAAASPSAPAPTAAAAPAPASPTPTAPAPSAPPSWSVPAGQAQFHAPSGSGQPPQPRLPLGQTGAIGVRPTGITIIAVLAGILGALNLWSAWVLWDDANTLNKYCGGYSFCNTSEYTLWAAISLAVAIAAFLLAYGLWILRPWAWPLGLGFCVGVAIVAVLTAASVHENNTVVGAAIDVGIAAAILYYLNLNPVRALFGRPPTTLLQPQPQGAEPPQGQAPQPPQWQQPGQQPPQWAQPPQPPQPAQPPQPQWGQQPQQPQPPQVPQPPQNPFQQPPQG